MCVTLRPTSQSLKKPKTQFLLRSCSIAGDHLKKQLQCPGIFHNLMQSNYIILHDMMQELLLLLLSYVILPNVPWQGFEPANSLSGARDHRCFAVAIIELIILNIMQ